MTNIEKIRAALEQAYKERHEPCSVELRIDEALAALAELERSLGRSSALMSWEICGCQTKPTHYVGAMPCPLNPAPPAPVAEIREVVVTDEMCDRAYIGKWRGVPELIGHEPDDEDRQWSREWLEAWRTELGPALGLVEIREPTPEECERICFAEMKIQPMQSWPAIRGRAMFYAVRAVLWPKEGL